MGRIKKATEIPPKVRNAVYQRDSVVGWPCCIACGKGAYDEVYENGSLYYYGLELHHYVERSRLGKGIAENLVTLCTECHHKLHNGDTEVKEACREYLESLYGPIDESKLTYHKEEEW